MISTRLFITVDTEVCAYDPEVDTPDTQIWGKTVDGKDYGIGFIMDELAVREWFCTFFLNVYDTNLWGDETVASIARNIKSRDFDVQLHTHVKNGLSSFSLADQRRILNEGAERLKKWTGVRPVWHRAGNLCANLDTVRACAVEGFVGDSSYLYGWPQCVSLGTPVVTGIPTGSEDKKPIGIRNQSRSLEGILELPITTFRTLPLFHNYRHLDLDACTYGELISIVRQAARQGLPQVVMLMHSFSFVRRTEQGYVANLENVTKFKKFLSAVAEVDKLIVVPLNSSLPSFSGGGSKEAGIGHSDLSSGLLLTYHRAWSHWGRSWKHKLLILLPLVILFILGVLVFCIRIYWR